MLCWPKLVLHKLLNVSSLSCLLAKVVKNVALKFGSLSINSLILSNVANDSGLILLSACSIALLTNSVLAIILLLLSLGAVGTSGVPINSGLANGA